MFIVPSLSGCGISCLKISVAIDLFDGLSFLGVSGLSGCASFTPAVSKPVGLRDCSV